MEGTIKDIKDDYTIVVEYKKNGKEKSEIMRIVDSTEEQIKKGGKVKFDLTEKDIYGRIICRVIKQRGHDRFF
ncbi:MULTISPECIES: hypothetical protein [Vibrio]|uniref:hypothetical protein n=1 Tax=Vibrio TaxID=662 RepID=UPI001C9C461A|nr:MULTISPECIES: hypothetical protein [Vibrio]EKO3915559.1 hypothetical protein [Vibrio fluvialis]MBY8067940.1 hypothetical protein [Vibrio fluvialis]MCE7659726.1 hypothetical protein [Vibrio fluvialis]WJG23726.1 hypothetical protein QSU95_22230 [Vibrio furnissii]